MFWLITEEGKLHNLDGPAIENYDGSLEYWIDNKPIPEEEFEIAAYLYKNQLENYK